jgi:hypothetical protein
MLNAMLVMVCLAQLNTVPYEQAVQDSQASGKPLLVIVESDGCLPCIAMKREVLQPMAAAGELDGIIVATLAPGAIAEQMKAMRTPTLVGFRKRDAEWLRFRMEGKQSRDGVRRLVKRLKE